MQLPLLSLFERPTIAGLAEALLADPAQCKRIERQAELLLTLAQMSDEEANRRLAEYAVQR